MGQQLKEFHEFFKDHVLDEPKSYYQYDDTPGVLPHVWFDVKQVPTHALAAITLPNMSCTTATHEQYRMSKRTLLSCACTHYGPKPGAHTMSS